MSIPLYMRGRGLKSLVITGQTIGTAGALSDSTAYTLSSSLDGYSESLQRQTENISAVNSTRANNMIVEDDNTITWRALKLNNGGDANQFKTAILLFDIVKAVWVEGDGASAKTTTAYGSITSMESGIEGKGKQIASLTMQQVDVGTATYAVS